MRQAKGPQHVGRSAKTSGNWARLGPWPAVFPELLNSCFPEKLLTQSNLQRATVQPEQQLQELFLKATGCLANLSDGFALKLSRISDTATARSCAAQLNSYVTHVYSLQTLQTSLHAGGPPPMLLHWFRFQHPLLGFCFGATHVWPTAAAPAAPRGDLRIINCLM